MKQLEIHTTGINAHYSIKSYYGVDYQTKKVVFNFIPTIEECFELGYKLGYKEWEICRMF